jgi:hypothetical protein
LGDFLTNTSGVDGRFSPIFGEKGAFFLKANVVVKIFQKLTVF